MKLHEIHKREGKTYEPTKERLRLMLFRKVHYDIFPSKQLVNDTGMQVGDHIIFAYSIDKPNQIFFRISNEGGAKLNYHNKSNHRYRCACAPIVSHVLYLSNAEKSVSFLVSKNPVSIDGKEWYQLLTSQPHYIV